MIHDASAHWNGIWSFLEESVKAELFNSTCFKNRESISRLMVLSNISHVSAT